MSFTENKTLMRLPGGEWTVGDAMRGVAVFGGTGSGKTSGSGKTLALKYLNEGWGGLVLCVKTDEAELWQKYCTEAGRGTDMIVFKDGSEYEPGVPMVFNPIDYEMKREGKGAGDPQNITNIFMNIYRMGNRISGGGDNREERFWDTALKRCITRIVELLILAEKDLTFDNMTKVLSSCKELEPVMTENKEKQPVEFSLDDLFHSALSHQAKGSDDYFYKDNFCFECLLAACPEDGKHTQAEKQSFNLVRKYFLHEFGSMGGRVRSTISESFMGLAEPFLSGLLFRHFSGGTNLYPEITFTENKIIILDFSVKEYLDAGIIAQSIYKMMFQQAVERRNIGDYPTPVFLWADEAQMFVNPYDQIFLTTARSKRVATVFLTQNIPNYLVVMGGGSDAKPKVDSLLGNLSTKIFHANMDAETNEYASRLIGQALFGMTSESKSQAVGHMESKTVGFSMQLRSQVLPLEFLRLRTGSDGHAESKDDFMVDAFITSLGKEWKWEEESEIKGKSVIYWRNYILATFDQRFKLNKS